MKNRREFRNINVKEIVETLMKKKIDYIAVDIDEVSIHRIPYIYSTIRDYFPEDKINVYVSPSGRGVHIIVEGVEVSFLENLLYRALFNDDAYRYMVSWKRMVLLYFWDKPDIIFDFKKKGGGEVGVGKKDDEMKEWLEKFYRGEMEYDEVMEKIYSKLKPRKVLTLYLPCEFRGLKFDEKLKKELVELIVNYLREKYKNGESSD